MKYITIWFLFLYIPSFSATPIVKVPKNDSLELRVRRLETRLQKAVTASDSLGRDLNYYRQKEDMYIALFERYASRADAYLGLIVAIIAFVPVAGIAYVRKLQKKIEQLETLQDRLITLESSVNNSQSEIYHNTSALMAMVSFFVETLKKPEQETHNATHVLNLLWESFAMAYKAYDLKGKQDVDGVVDMIFTYISDFMLALEKCNRQEVLELFAEKAKIQPHWLESDITILHEVGKIPDARIVKAAAKLKVLLIECNEQHQEIMKKRSQGL